jgi:hypothetical protein
MGFLCLPLLILALSQLLIILTATKISIPAQFSVHRGLVLFYRASYVFLGVTLTRIALIVYLRVCVK